MSNVVKNVFLVIMWAVIAVTAYGVFFGVGKWEGLLWSASRNVSYSMSKFYYDYCYLPAVHGTDAIDKEVSNSWGIPSLYKTESNLSTRTEYGNLNNESENKALYSTGWQ